MNLVFNNIIETEMSKEELDICHPYITFWLIFVFEIICEINFVMISLTLYLAQMEMVTSVVELN